MGRETAWVRRANETRYYVNAWYWIDILQNIKTRQSVIQIWRGFDHTIRL